jgi:hypothetical protein
MTSLAKYATAFQTGNPGQMFQGWNALSQEVAAIEAALGAALRAAPNSPSLSAPPSPAAFSVVGIDGKFIVFVTSPAQIQPVSVAILLARIKAGASGVSTQTLYHLQSATSLNFDQSSDLKDYGTSSQMVWVDQDPNVTRFFRLQSSFDGQNWNAWQFYSSAEQCGPVGVWSGLLRSAALVQVNTSSTPLTQPLSATTGTAVNDATIDVAAFQVQYPDSISPATSGVVGYNSGAITGLLDSTVYYVYCLDTMYSGGAQTYLATTSQEVVTQADATVYLGTITTPAHGGGGTTGGGGGNGPPCFSGGTNIITKDGIKFIVDVIGGHDEVLTQRGWRRVRRLLRHSYDGPMQEMSDTEFVTPPHRFWYQRAWARACEIFTKTLARFTEDVFNLEIDGDGSDEEQCYTLANGWIAHNARK